MLTISGQTQQEAINPNYEEDDLGFVIDLEKSEEWMRAFKTQSTHLTFQPILSVEDMEAAAASLTEDIQCTNEEVLCKCRPVHPKASP